jgi:hypothetical protein
MPLHGIIERAHSDVTLHCRRSDIRPRRQKTKQGNANPTKQKSQNGDDNPQNKISHFQNPQALEPRLNISFITAR